MEGCPSVRLADFWPVFCVFSARFDRGAVQCGVRGRQFRSFLAESVYIHIYTHIYASKRLPRRVGRGKDAIVCSRSWNSGSNRSAAGVTTDITSTTRMELIGPAPEVFAGREPAKTCPGTTVSRKTFTQQNKTKYKDNLKNQVRDQ